MNKYLKEFLHRGLMFGGFGPIVLAIVYCFLEHSIPNLSVTGTNAALAIISVYLIAFVQAGATVFNQIEHWPVMKGLLFHFLSLYAVYVLCYLINSWIPFKAEIIVIFTAIFVAVYAAIWIIVYLSTKGVSKKFNSNL